MQYSSLISAATALIATVSAAPTALTSRSDGYGEFHVSDFFASGGRYSIQTTYRFTVGDFGYAARCSASVSTSPEISYAPTTFCKNDAGDNVPFQFNFGGAEGGYQLNITYFDAATSASDYTYIGTKFFPSSDVKTTEEEDPNAEYQYLDAPSNFTVPYHPF